MRPMHEHGNRDFGPRQHHPRGGRPLPPEGGPRSHRRGGGRGRAPRGDVRTAVLLLLAEEPMHGYQLMQAISDRCWGRWRPSRGEIYPTIIQLEDEGLVAVTADAGRKLVTLTDAGREHVESLRTTTPDPFASFTRQAAGADLRGLLEQLHGAVREVGRSGSDTQVAAAADILREARRSVYLRLAADDDSAAEGER